MPSQKLYASKFNAQRAAASAGFDRDRIEVFKRDGRYGYRPKPASEPESPKPADPQPKPARKPRIRYAELEAAARRGEMPPVPDFSAPTHARYRAKLRRLAELANAGDIEALKAFEIKPYSSSRKAMARYRDLAVIALEAKRR